MTKYVGRRELLEWINLFAHVEKIEEMGNGKAAALVLHSLDPVFPLEKLTQSNFRNLALIQEYFMKNHIKVNFPIEKLAQCRLQDNLEFAQWLYSYYASNSRPEEGQKVLGHQKADEEVFRCLKDQKIFPEKKFPRFHAYSASLENARWDLKKEDKENFALKPEMNNIRNQKNMFEIGKSEIPEEERLETGTKGPFYVSERDFGAARCSRTSGLEGDTGSSLQLFRPRGPGQKFVEKIRALEDERNFYYRRLRTIEKYAQESDEVCRKRLLEILYGQEQ